MINLLSVLTTFTLLGPGTMSYADKGVLEKVAERRIQNEWGLDNTQGYDVFIALVDCQLLGRKGWLLVDNTIHPIIVVDCSQKKHRQEMIERDLLGDINKKELVHKEGWVFLR